MKNFLLVVTLLFSVIVSAEETDVKAQSLHIANMMINLPKVTAKLRAENLSIVDYSMVDLNNGVKKFTFKLARTCFCIPLTGTLKVTQDMRPTYADGAIEYTTKLTLDKP